LRPSLDPLCDLDGGGHRRALGMEARRLAALAVDVADASDIGGISRRSVVLSGFAATVRADIGILHDADATGFKGYAIDDNWQPAAFPVVRFNAGFGFHPSCPKSVGLIFFRS